MHANWLQISSKDHRLEIIWFDIIYAFQKAYVCLTHFFEKAIMSKEVPYIFYHRIMGAFRLEKILKIIKSKNRALGCVKESGRTGSYYLRILWEFNFIFPRSGVNSSWSWVLYYQKCKAYVAMKWYLWKPDLVALYADGKIAFQFLNPQNKEQWMSAVQIIIQHVISPWDTFTLLSSPFSCKDCVKHGVLARLMIIMPCKGTSLNQLGTACWRALRRGDLQSHPHLPTTNLYFSWKLKLRNSWGTLHYAMPI